MIIVTAITPTKAGEGKTTTSIALTQGLGKIRRTSCSACASRRWARSSASRAAARAAATRRWPMEDINLHFNGDFHAVTAAHSLLAAAIDASIFNGNPLRIDPATIMWPRTVDMNDRELRYTVVGLGGKAHGIPRAERVRHHRRVRGDGRVRPGQRSEGSPAPARPHRCRVAPTTASRSPPTRSRPAARCP